MKQLTYKRLDKEYELAYQINNMNEFSKRIVNRAKEIKSLNNFYRIHDTYVISSLTAPDIIGFKDFYCNDNTILYTFELKIQEGEYFTIKKRDFNNKLK